MEQAIFLWQLAFFNARWLYLAFAIMPIPLFASSHFSPESRKFTVWVNPGSQFACFIPYFATVVREGTTLGISLLSCHLSACGNLCGLAMCGIKANCSPEIVTAIGTNSLRKCTMPVTMWLTFR
jgi:hypothetical protein